MKSAIIIPVFNEGERVIPVIEAAQSSDNAKEIIVVNDGSTDNSAQVISEIEDITVLGHAFNKGKGEAMDTGMRYAQDRGYQTAVFLDGDLRGLRPDHVDQLLAPLSDEVFMTIGYLGLRKAAVKRVILNRWGALSGERAIRTEVWDLLNNQDKHGFNIEAALNARLRQQELHRNIVRVELDGVGHVGKHEKLDSWPKALKGYVKMYGSAILTYARIQAEGAEFQSQSSPDILVK
jgi:glycosyltransferase involved in cell wall biosynthesis